MNIQPLSTPLYLASVVAHLIAGVLESFSEVAPLVERNGFTLFFFGCVSFLRATWLIRRTVRKAF